MSELSDGWSTTVQLPPYSWPKEDFPSGTCRAWAEQGWLIVERRTDQNELEWKIVLAKFVGEEPPKIDVPEPGRLRVSYRDGHYFIRDEHGSFRCVRQPKQPDDAWPSITLPKREPDLGGPVGQKIDTFFEKDWCFVATGPKRGSIDCLVRLNHRELIKSGALCGVNVSSWLSRGDSGELSLLDDGDLLVGERLEEWVARKALARLEVRKRIRGSPAPELTGTWLNTGGESLAWKDLKGNSVLLVFFDFVTRVNGVPVLTEHLPALKQLDDNFYAKGLVILGVCTRIEAKAAERLIDEHRIKFPMLIDQVETGERFGVDELPCYFLVDRESKVVWGNLPSLPATAEIEKLLKKE